LSITVFPPPIRMDLSTLHTEPMVDFPIIPFFFFVCSSSGVSCSLRVVLDPSLPQAFSPAERSVLAFHFSFFCGVLFHRCVGLEFLSCLRFFPPPVRVPASILNRLFYRPKPIAINQHYLLGPLVGVDFSLDEQFFGLTVLLSDVTVPAPDYPIVPFSDF